MRGKEAFVTGLVCALLFAAPAAHAACTESSVRTHAAHSRALAIGDSTMVFAVRELAKLGIDADARPCRSWAQGLDMLRALKGRHRLPRFVVMALGANSWVRPIDVQRALAIIGPGRKLGLLTHRTWAGKPGPDTGVIRRMAHRYHSRTVLMDWVRFARVHESWFRMRGYDDGLHPNKQGAQQFARFIARHVP